MSNANPSPFLRRVLIFDAASCAVMGLALTIAAESLEEMLTLPAALSRGAGTALLLFAVFVGYVGTQAALSRTAVWVIVALNAIWSVDSILVLAAGWIEPNGLGQAFVVAQAIAVAIIAELEFVGIRRSGALAA